MMQYQASMIGKLFSLAAIILNLMSCNVSSQAQDSNLNPKACKNALASVNDKLANQNDDTDASLTDRQVVIKISKTNDAKRYESYPQARPGQYSFLLNFTGASFSIMNLDALLNFLATEVIGSCNSVSLVQFSVDKTHYAIDYGLMPDGNVAKLECPAGFDVSNYAKTPQWGEVCRA